MNCLKQSITQSLSDAYAHHIQRLMIIGNYALLTQTNPDEVDAWYLGIYIDAIQWVELPNTRGMSQFADGIVATKPYVSSANYIKKMGNYCNKCYYKPPRKQKKTLVHLTLVLELFDEKHHFQNNQRMSMMLNLLKKNQKKR